MFGKKRKGTDKAPAQNVRNAVFESDNPTGGRRKHMARLDDEDEVRKAAEADGPEASKKPSRKERRAQKKAEAGKKYTFAAYPYLKSIKPREKYVFHSDYFQVDGRVATIMSFFHVDGASDNFGAFWGVNKIPAGLSRDVEIILFEQSRKMTEGWLSDRQNSSEGLAQINENAQNQGGSNQSKMNANRRSQDLMEISKELQNGAAYLHVHFRLMVIAPSLKDLDVAVSKIERTYIDRFATLSAAAYFGEQRNELAHLFSKNEKKEGHGFYLTSIEYAGAYNLVTHGLEDADGEYVGQMVGDVNNAAVLFNTNGYGHTVIVADETYDSTYSDRMRATSLWGSKLSQSCLLSNGRCVHLILDGTDLDKIGPKMKNITYKLDLNKGDVNMFEMFGDRKNQLAIFPSQMQKLILMAEQAYEATDAERGIIRGSLEEVATRFYVDQRMWYENAKAHEDQLRIVGIPHEQVPKLDLFVSYLDTEYKAMVAKTARDDEKLHAMSVLAQTFKNLLSNNGDLFNTITSSAVDGAVTGRRVIYDFSQLMQRGRGIAMAQLVNVISFAVSSLGLGDTVFVHGADKIDDGVKAYVNTQFEKLFDAGGRVVYLYNSIDKMLADRTFCRYDRTDYMIFGNMSEGQVTAYQEAIGQKIPADLTRLITNKSESINYIRRGFDNIVFTRDLTLGVDMDARQGGYRR